METEPHWLQDPHFLFDGGIGKQADFYDLFGGQVPLVRIHKVGGIIGFFHRLGLSKFLKEHLDELESMPQLGDTEVRMMREFAYGFTVKNAHNRKYTIFAFVWYFRNRPGQNRRRSGHRYLARWDGRIG